MILISPHRWLLRVPLLAVLAAGCAELPQHLLDAVVAIEDDRFWHHKGVDVKAILRAAVTNTEQGGVDRRSPSST